jgi:hypothetical protein
MEEDPIVVRVGKNVTLTFEVQGLPYLAALRPSDAPEGLPERVISVACRRARFSRLSYLLRSGAVSEDDVRKC